MTIKQSFRSYDLGISTFPQGLRQVYVSKKGVITFSWNEVECEQKNGVVLGHEIKLYSDEQVYTRKVFGSSTTVAILPQRKFHSSLPKAISVAAFNEAGVGSHCPPVNISQLG